MLSRYLTNAGFKDAADQVSRVMKESEIATSPRTPYLWRLAFTYYYTTNWDNIANKPNILQFYLQCHMFGVALNTLIAPITQLLVAVSQTWHEILHIQHYARIEQSVV